MIEQPLAWESQCAWSASLVKAVCWHSTLSKCQISEDGIADPDARSHGCADCDTLPVLAFGSRRPVCINGFLQLQSWLSSLPHQACRQW